jgi:hypothetical protein
MLPPDFSINFSDWVLFAGWADLVLALFGLLLVTLLIIWWRQQTIYWFRIVMITFLMALMLSIGAYYYFVVPPYYIGCPQGCPGWRGFPLPIARIEVDGTSNLAPLDFLLNLLMLWLLWLGATLFWSLFAHAIQWSHRSWRSRLLFVFFFALLPWAMLPRILDPPQPTPTGEELRLAINATRSAEFTYRITGPWVQRLALEDMRAIEPVAGVETLFGDNPVNQVCLRGYTYFYIPWRRYRITLDPSGVTALSFAEIELEGSCWQP